MALARCRECGSQVSTEAPACPHCGVPKPGGDATDIQDHLSGGSEPTSGGGFSYKTMIDGCLGLIVGGVLLFLIWMFFFPHTDPTDDPLLAAYTMCQQFVEERLQSPGTAEFECCPDNTTREVGDDTYEVRAYVDSENALGGLVRIDFVCTVRATGLGVWNLVSLDFN